MREAGFLAEIKDSFITPSGCLVLLAGVLAGKATVGKVELRLNLVDRSPGLQSRERSKLVRFGKTLGLGVFKKREALHGTPFRLLLSKVDLAPDDRCIVAHEWDFAPHLHTPKIGKE